VSEEVIEERRARFKVDVRKFASSSVVDRHVIFGDSYILDDDSYFNLKERIADHFNIHPPQVVMVGSGKLGFSIANPKRYRSFGETSDLDIAIVAPNLFDRIWEEVFRARGKFGYWPEEFRFSSYLARGWIRPDKLPPAHTFEIANDWWKFFDSLAASGDFGRFKIRGGLYRDWIFLKGYQNLAVLGCQEELEAEPEAAAVVVSEPLVVPEEPGVIAAEPAAVPSEPTVAVEEPPILAAEPAMVVAEPLVVPEEPAANATSAESDTNENNGNESKA
jgi:hypothetical protein